MANTIIHPHRVRQIKHLIERQIQLRVEQLATFVQLKKAIEHREFHGQLLKTDLEMIAEALEKMQTEHKLGQ